MLRRLAIWGYDSSLAGLVKPNVSESTKVGYTVGANVAALAITGAILIALNGMLRK